MLKEKLMLIDGNSLLYRAFFALPSLKTAQGISTNAVYGFLNMLFRLLEEEKPTHLAVAFDKGPSFRKEEFEEYKAQRQKMPEELSQQFPILKEILEAMGIVSVEVPNYEGDDLLGTLAKQGEAAGMQTVIVTGDRDVFQLVSSYISVILTKKGITETVRYDQEKIKEEYGLMPRQFIDLKGLMGDSSDNIPGIPKVGEKTALKLLHEFGSLEGVLEHAEMIKGKLGETIKAYKQQAILSKKLATIKCDVPIPMTLNDCRMGKMDKIKLTDLFRQYEFRKFLGRLEEDEPSVNSFQSDAKVDYIAVENEKTMEELFSTLKNLGETCFYLLHEGNTIYGFALTAGEDVYFVSKQNLSDFDHFLARIMEDKQTKKACHGAKQLMHVLAENGCILKGLDYDQEVAAYLLNPSENGYPIENIVRENLQREIRSEDFVFGTGRRRRKMAEVPAEQLAEYAAERVKAINDARGIILSRLKENDLLGLYREVEMPLVEVLFLMERAGVKVDLSRLQAMGAEIGQKIEELQQEIFILAGHSFNVNSTQQLGTVLFEELRLPPVKKTKTGYSTDVNVLEQLSGAHPIIELLLKYRQLVKLKGTYVDGLQKLINAKTGCIHTTFNQTVTATGRLSSTEPNLQNIPIRFPEGRKIRQAFIPNSPEMVILSADYSQIELRILAHITGDPNLVDAFRRGQDIHTRTAAEVFGVPMDQVTKEMRAQAKAVNFGIIYGMSDFRLANEVGISRRQAKQFIENYFATYGGVKKYIMEIIQQAREKGFVTTLLNRRRYLPEINSRNFTVRQFAERTAVNTPIQGTAADIIKIAMVNLAERFKKENLPGRMLLQVHDELIFEVYREYLGKIAVIVKEEMEKAFPLSVPLRVEVKAGANWYEVEKIEGL